MVPLTRERAQQILEDLTVENDGQQADILLELVNGIYDPDNVVALAVRDDLYAMTEHSAESKEQYLAA